MKTANPELPILVREASGIEAKLIARFGALRGGKRVLAATGEGAGGDERRSERAFGRPAGSR